MISNFLQNMSAIDFENRNDPLWDETDRLRINIISNRVFQILAGSTIFKDCERILNRRIELNEVLLEKDKKILDIMYLSENLKAAFNWKQNVPNVIDSALDRIKNIVELYVNCIKDCFSNEDGMIQQDNELDIIRFLSMQDTVTLDNNMLEKLKGSDLNARYRRKLYFRGGEFKSSKIKEANHFDVVRYTLLRTITNLAKFRLVIKKSPYLDPLHFIFKPYNLDDSYQVSSDLDDQNSDTSIRLFCNT